VLSHPPSFWAIRNRQSPAKTAGVSIVMLSAMTSAVAVACLCIGVTSLRRLFATSQFLSFVTQRQSADVNRAQDVLLNKNSEDLSAVATPIMERVRVPGSRIVTGGALHLLLNFEPKSHHEHQGIREGARERASPAAARAPLPPPTLAYMRQAWKLSRGKLRSPAMEHHGRICSASLRRTGNFLDRRPGRRDGQCQCLM
jgi:hypothetical protein